MRPKFLRLVKFLSFIRRLPEIHNQLWCKPCAYNHRLSPSAFDTLDMVSWSIGWPKRSPGQADLPNALETLAEDPFRSHVLTKNKNLAKRIILCFKTVITLKMGSTCGIVARAVTSDISLCCSIPGNDILF